MSGGTGGEDRSFKIRETDEARVEAKRKIRERQKKQLNEKEKGKKEDQGFSRKIKQKMAKERERACVCSGEQGRVLVE